MCVTTFFGKNCLRISMLWWWLWRERKWCEHRKSRFSFRGSSVQNQTKEIKLGIQFCKITFSTTSVESKWTQKRNARMWVCCLCDGIKFGGSYGFSSCRLPENVSASNNEQICFPLNLRSKTKAEQTVSYESSLQQPQTNPVPHPIVRFLPRNKTLPNERMSKHIRRKRYFRVVLLLIKSRKCQEMTFVWCYSKNGNNNEEDDTFKGSPTLKKPALYTLLHRAYKLLPRDIR